MIENLLPRLPEIGKIKIGYLGEEKQGRQGGKYRLPRKIDHFLITLPERGEDGNFKPDMPLMKRIAEKTGQDPNHLTSLPCFLFYDGVEPNLYTTYCCYKGRTKICQGNGKEAVTSQGETRPCPCEKIDRGYKGPAICKPYCRLSLALAETERIGGVWVYRSCGWNTVQNLMGSLALLVHITNGHIAGVPLTLELVGKTAVTPTGKLQKIYTVFLAYQGDLKSLAGQKALSMETEPLPIETDINQEEDEEIAEEFYSPEADEVPPPSDGMAEKEEKSAAELVMEESKKAVKAETPPAPKKAKKKTAEPKPKPEPPPTPETETASEPEAAPEIAAPEPAPEPDDAGDDADIEDLWG